MRQRAPCSIFFTDAGAAELGLVATLPNLSAPMKADFLEKTMQGQKHKNVGRSPQRSQTISGDETKGLTAISTQQGMQPSSIDLATADRSVRPRPILSLPMIGAIEPPTGAASPEQA